MHIRRPKYSVCCLLAPGTWAIRHVSPVRRIERDDEHSSSLRQAGGAAVSVHGSTLGFGFALGGWAAPLGHNASTMSFYPRNMRRSVVHPLLPLLSTLGLEYNISMEGVAWQGRPGKADRAAHRSRARRAGRRLDLRGDFLESVKTGMLPWSTR